MAFFFHRSFSIERFLSDERKKFSSVAPLPSPSGGRWFLEDTAGRAF
jgi:hypothetical protein